MRRVVRQLIRSAGRGTSVVLAGGVFLTMLTHALEINAQRVHSQQATQVELVHGGGSNSGHAQGYLGVTIRDVAEDQLASLKLNGSANQPHGAEIFHVDHDGPAGKAGLREHDVVLVLNGQPVDGGEPLRRMLRETSPGNTVTLLISRDGQQQTVSAQMANREDVEREAWEQHIIVSDPAAPAPSDPPRRANGFFSTHRNMLGTVLSPGYTGAMLETMAPQLADYFGAQGRTGLLVRSVDGNSPAEVAGMRAGDVVVRVNTANIATSGDWVRAVHDNKGKSIAVVVLRDRRELVLTMIPNGRHRSSLLPERWPHLGGSGAARGTLVPVSGRQATATGAPGGFA